MIEFAVESDEQAAAVAENFAILKGWGWGKAGSVTRTVADRYRVSFGKSPNGRERVLLVHPGSGRTEVPLKR